MPPAIAKYSTSAYRRQTMKFHRCQSQVAATARMSSELGILERAH